MEHDAGRVKEETAENETHTALVQAALRLLGVRKFAIAIHDVSFPATPDEDIGRGSPYSRGGLEFLEFARTLGFNTVQLGPQGVTTRKDPSPYNGAIFSRSILALSPTALCEDDLLRTLASAAELQTLCAETAATVAAPDQADHQRAWELSARLLNLLYARFCERRTTTAAPLAEAFAQFRAEQQAAPVNWLERDCIYEALTQASGINDWRLWGTPASGLLPIDQRLYCPHAGEEHACRRRIAHIGAEQAAVIARFAFGQFVLQRHHLRLRATAEALGLRLYGDMHIGCAHRDLWAWRALFLHDYLLGAPPSRTNPEGQPWGYPVLHPREIYTLGAHDEIVRGAAADFLCARAGKLLTEFDGIRIDHPQGLVCPWVYQTDDPDPFHAVRTGARLYSAPDYPDHPGLRQFALVRPDQLNPDPDCTRYADEHVATLTPEQIERYAVALDTVIHTARACGRRVDDIMCEVLSTWPMPLKTVMQQRGMGRLCVTQKADSHNPHDVYRSENTTAGDWIMMGNHDTKPVWLVVEERRESDWLADRAGLLAQRLAAAPDRRQALAARLLGDHRLFCEAMCAELFLGPAQNVSIFFPDLFGERQLYNQPGTVGMQNWALRLPPDYRALYAQRVRRGEALDLKRALALALETRRNELGADAVDLAAKLRSVSAWRD